MDINAISGSNYLFYDPIVYGFSTDFFHIHGGIVNQLTNGKIRVLGGNTSTTAMVVGGKATFKVTIPTVPTAGDSRYVGLYSKSYGNQNAAYFFISGTNFYARSYNDTSATAEQTTITWNGDWTNTAITLSVRRSINRVEFFINGNKVATHTNYIPKMVLVPMYLSNNTTENADADSMYIDWIRVEDSRDITYAVAPAATNVVYTSISPSASVSPSASPSPSSSESASTSPSPSPSSSTSASVSPSASTSPSTSESASPSPSSSISASTSPSSSPSSSSSASISPSASSSPSASPSPSSSPSSSVSPSPSS